MLQMYDPRKQLLRDIKRNFAHYDNVVEKACAILEHYTCPPECNAACCKFSRIRFEKKEYYKILETVDADTRIIIEQKTVTVPSTHSYKANIHGKDVVRLVEDNEYFRAFPADICPMLDGLNCNIYQHRPAVCRLYPFEITGDCYDLAIRACPLGLDVILDYAAWLETAGQDAEEIKQAAYNLWLERNKDVAHVHALMIDNLHNLLQEFQKYLENNTLESRKLERDKIIQQKICQEMNIMELDTTQNNILNSRQEI